jgi:hypothetical protein
MERQDVMTKYPLLFTYRDKLDVRGSQVEVTVHGQVLAVHEAEGWWFYGVRPGDLAESGATSGEAQSAFRMAFSEVLLDIAASAPSTAAFRDEVHAWFDAVNQPVHEGWLAAVDEVRAGRVKADLEQKPADSPRWVEVQVLQHATEPIKFDPPLAVAA